MSPLTRIGYQIKGPGGALEALYKARDEGKIRHLGITSHDPAVLPIL